MFTNSPNDITIDYLGQLGTSLYSDGLLTRFLNEGLVHAYSISRKLVDKSTNTNAFRVRRSSDNAEQDIGFVGHLVDTASLSTFIGANSGFVVTVYDQVGSSDATQSTAGNQYRVVNAGTLELINNRLYAHNATGVINLYPISSSFNLTNASLFGVSHILTASSGEFVNFIANNDAGFSDEFTTAPVVGGVIFRLDSTSYQKNVTITDDNSHSLSIIYDGSQALYYHDNIPLGSEVVPSGTFTASLLFRCRNNILVSEAIIFDKVISETSRFLINKDMDEFYGI